MRFKAEGMAHPPKVSPGMNLVVLEIRYAESVPKFSAEPSQSGQAGSQPQVAQLLISDVSAGSAEILVHNTPDADAAGTLKDTRRIQSGTSKCLDNNSYLHR